MVDQHEQQPLPSSAKRAAELIEEGALATVAATKQLIVYRGASVADAEDAVSQAFEEFCRNVHMGEPVGTSPRTWIRRRAQSRYIDAIRKRSRSPLRADMETLFEDEVDYRVSPENAVEITDSTLRVLRLINQLPEGQRQVLKLIAIDQLSHSETAAELNISTGAVSKRLTAARKTLRTKLGDQGIAHALAMEVDQVQALRQARGSKKTIQEGGGP